VGIVVTLTLGFFFAFFLIENQKRAFLQAKKRRSETLSTLINQAVINFMKEGETKEFSLIILNLFGIAETCWRSGSGRERDGSSTHP